MENEEIKEELIVEENVQETTEAPKKVIRRRRKKGEKPPKKKKKKRGPGRPRKVKMGRPKKRGPKKKRRRKKVVVKKKRISRKNQFKLVACYNGKQSESYGTFKNVEDARAKINELMERQNSIVFPKMYENKRTGIDRPKYEYLLLERNLDGTKNPMKVIDEFGNERVQENNLPEWVIVDKIPFVVEETFWVFGKNPKTDRKTFSWIFSNIVMRDSVNENNIRRIYLFRNKILLKDDNGSMELVICKIEADAIRFYNMLSSMLKGDKRFMILKGSHNVPEKRDMVCRDIMKLTGWSSEKTQMKTSRKCNTTMPI